MPLNPFFCWQKIPKPLSGSWTRRSFYWAGLGCWTCQKGVTCPPEQLCSVSHNYNWNKIPERSFHAISGEGITQGMLRNCFALSGNCRIIWVGKDSQGWVQPDPDLVTSPVPPSGKAQKQTKHGIKRQKCGPLLTNAKWQLCGWSQGAVMDTHSSSNTWTPNPAFLQQNLGAHFYGCLPGNNFPVSCSPWPSLQHSPSSSAVRGTFQQLAVAPCHSSFVFRDHLQRLFIAGVQIPAFPWHDEWLLSNIISGFLLFHTPISLPGVFSDQIQRDWLQPEGKEKSFTTCPASSCSYLMEFLLGLKWLSTIHPPSQ